MVQHATVEEAVFSVDLTDTPVDWLDSDHVICVSRNACLFHSYVSESDRIHSRQLQGVVAAEARKQASSKFEEYRKSACEGLMCDLETLRVP
jgi:hypothetical protein